MKKGRLSVNIVANFASKIWVAGIGIVLVPLYIKFLGIESYGLVGFYGTLIGSLTLLDMGLSTTLNRELAKARATNASAIEVRNMVLSLERIYWIIGITIAVLVIIFAQFIATRWVKTEHLSPETIKNTIILMGLVVAFQWPISLYNGGLMGMERQVLDSILMISMTTLRAAGILVIFLLIKPSLELFFIWQAVTSFLYVAAMRIGLWHYLPKAKQKARFSFLEVKKIWRFAAGMTGISLVTFFIMQIDKILLSNLLPLSQYAYYVFSFTIATSLSILVAPINASFFPRLAGLAAKGDEEGLKQTYHKACKLVSTVVFPAAFVIFFFAHNLILDWTGNEQTANNSYKLVRVLIAGSMCNSMMVIPYLLILAKGQTRFVIIQNLIAAIILVPMLFWWTRQFGPLGATFVWLTVNAGYIIFSIPLVHKQMMKTELRHWYIQDTLLPLLPSLILIGGLKLIMLTYFPNVNFGLIGLGFIAAFALMVSLFFLEEFRRQIVQKINYYVLRRERNRKTAG